MLFRNNIFAVINFLAKLKNINVKKNYYPIIFNHITKVNFVVYLAIKIYFFIINLYSLIIYFKFFHKLKFNQIKIIIRASNFFFKFLSGKCFEVIHAIICIHIYNSDKAKKNKRKTVLNDFYEFIVIGSGPGGSITANILNKNFPGKTLLIEKGEEYEAFKSKHSGDELKNQWNDGGITSTIFPLQINFSSGMSLGGGSQINSGLYHEPDEIFCKEWKKKYQVKNLNFKDLNKFTKIIKKILKPRIIRQNIPFEKYFLKGIDKTKNKFQYIPRLSFKNNKNTASSTMLKTFINEYKKNHGNIASGIEIQYIKRLSEGWEVYGKNNSKKFKIRCRYLFLCCGSIYTNSLLLNSLRFKNKKKLDNFYFHPMIKVLARYPNKIQEMNQDVSSLQIVNFYPKFIIGSASSSKQFMMVSAYDDKKIYTYINKYWQNITTYHSTFSFGEGKIVKVPLLKKDIFFYNIDNAHLKLIKKALFEMINFAFASGSDEVILLIKKDKKILKRDNYKKFIEKIKNISELNISSVHIMGGVTMGENNDCIADSFGKIKEFRDLYVNDSSLINNKLLKNPQGTVMSLAYRNINEFIKNYENRSSSS